MTAKSWLVDPATLPHDDLHRRVRSGDVVQCESCLAYLSWQALPEGSVLLEGNGVLSFWGAPCEEKVVTGFVCPECNARNAF